MDSVGLAFKKPPLAVQHAMHGGMVACIQLGMSYSEFKGAGTRAAAM